MFGFIDVFDLSGRVRRPSYLKLLPEGIAFLSYFPPLPPTAGLQRGDSGRAPGEGHVVLALPAFLSFDPVTAQLRRFLAALGYRPQGWEQGCNLGPTSRILAGLDRQLDRLVALEGGPVSLVGISLGGLLARHLAFERPQKVRQVVTLASPFVLPTATTIWPLVAPLLPLYADGLDFKRLASAPPVPATAIWTAEDGLVAAESCQGRDSLTVNIEVSGRHTTIARNPRALVALARRMGEVLAGDTIE